MKKLVTRQYEVATPQDALKKWNEDVDQDNGLKIFGPGFNMTNQVFDSVTNAENFLMQAHGKFCMAICVGVQGADFKGFLVGGWGE